LFFIVIYNGSLSYRGLERPNPEIGADAVALAKDRFCFVHWGLAMKHIASLIVGTLLMLMLSALTARADDWEVCHTANGDEQISACSNPIASGNLNGHDLVGAYIGRGMARADKGDLDGAIADYNQAIKLDPKDGFPYQARSMVRKDKGDISDCFYDSGLGLPQDFSEAAKWYRKAADQGQTRAQLMLSKMYFSGRGDACRRR
jgi:tetratricopeptide (TPR) repeat protein